MSKQITARRYDTGEPITLDIDQGIIQRVSPTPSDGRLEEWPFVAPGLFDMQINGYDGIWFSDASLTPSQVTEIVTGYFAHGVTQLFPTLITNSFEAIEQGLKAIRAACEQDGRIDQAVAGCHIEGPYISPNDGPRGAHSRQHVRPPDGNEFSRWQEASGGRIKMMTISPEWPNASEFIRQLVASGVVVAIGHTDANSDQIEAAVQAGATFSTHLGNGIHPMLPRHPNPIWDQLAAPQLTAGLITDGHHLPVNFIRSVIAAKRLRDVVITCDASGWAGCPPGRYSSELCDVDLLPSGRLTLAGKPELLAGSAFTTEFCVDWAIENCGLTLAQAWDTASKNPRRVFGVPAIDLQRGSAANLVVFHKQPSQPLMVEEVLVVGETVFHSQLN